MDDYKDDSGLEKQISACNQIIDLLSKITDEMKLKAAKSLAALVKKPTAQKIVPGAFEKGVSQAVARAIK